MVFETYQDAQDLHRWRLIAGNGETIADSGQGYQTKEEMKSAMNLMRSNAKYANDVAAQGS